ERKAWSPGISSRTRKWADALARALSPAGARLSGRAPASRLFARCLVHDQTRCRAARKQLVPTPGGRPGADPPPAGRRRPARAAVPADGRAGRLGARVRAARALRPIE